jgi:MFS family permease
MKEVGEKLTAEHPLIKKKIEKSLNRSVKEGSLSSISSALGLSYFTPLALAMNATISQVGILHAVAGLLPSLSQLKSSQLVEKFSRKKIVMTSVILQILTIIPMIITGFLFFMGVPHMVWVLIALIGLFHIFGAAAHPAWFSWMGSLVPEEKRGRYFSRRNRAAGFFGLITLLLSAIFLDYAKSYGSTVGNILGFTFLGFGILFMLAMLFRSLSVYQLAKQYEPRLKVKKKDYFTFWQFLKKSRDTPFGRFTIFRFIMSFATGVAAPFWTVYMLRNLGFSYVWYMMIIVSLTLFQLIFFPLLGKFSDRFGNVALMKLTSFLIFTIPLLWLLSPLFSGLAVKIYLLTIPAIVDGFAWAGFHLAANNYIYDAVRQEKRTFCLSYMNLMIGIGLFVGAGVGSAIALLNIPFMETILFIFLVSAVLRFVAFLIGPKYLREVRHVKHFSSHFLIQEFRPFQGISRVIHNFNHHSGKEKHHL